MNTSYRIILLSVATCSLLWLSSCTSDSQSNEGSNFDRPAMLSNYASNAIVPAYVNLQQQVNQLQSATSTFASDPDEANLNALQNQLKAARLAWQDANIFQFGPAESVTLRSALNIYPPDSAKIESNIDSGDYTLGSIDNQAAAGFPTVGYLVHGLGETSQKIISFYTDSSDASARITYLQDNISFMKQGIDATANEWQASGDNYIAMFTSEENAGTDVGSSMSILINTMVQHYERFLRDGKIGIPAGVRSAGVPRPSATEAYYGGYSLELAIANLEAIKRIFRGTGLNGTDGLGIEENLQAQGAGDLSNEIITEIDQAIAALEELNDPLAEQINTNNEPVLAAFQEMQDIVTLLKADMTSVLGITITYQDNDGD
ncbi:MAG: imelysin family protein [Balneolaceae bacterium]|nr:imelysin family protein [Balneolaceae bacterium]